MFPRFLIGLYFDAYDPENAAQLAVALLIIPIGALFQVVDGLQCVAIGALRGLKDTRIPMIMCFIGYCAIGIAASLLLTFVLGLGARGVWLGLLIGLTASGGLLTLRFQILSRRLAEDGRAGLAVVSRA